MPALTDKQALSSLAQPSAPWISWSLTPLERSWLRSSWLHGSGCRGLCRHTPVQHYLLVCPGALKDVLKPCIWELNLGLWPLLSLVFF